MRKFVLIWMLCFASFLTHAQPYNNEWIDYSKTYYKFNVGKTGLYRINQQNLPTALQNISADQFQLWRNGQQVAIYTSKSSGIFSSSDYIEFWGEQNDGKPDRALYKNLANQLDETLSLETDTAAYFLTVNSTGNNLRIIDATNNVAGNSLPPESSFLYDYHYTFKQMINRGKAVDYGEYVYSSTYDVGEWWSSFEVNPGAAITNTASNLYVANSGTASLQVSAAGTSTQGIYNNVPRKLNVTVNGITYINKNLYSLNDGPFAAEVFSANIPLLTISSGTATFSITDVVADIVHQANDRIVAGFIDLKYPRLFNFGAAANFSFTLPATTQGNFLQISNFDSGKATPVLYDLTNNKRYAAVSASGFIEFALPPSSLERTLVLVSEDASNINYVTNFVQRNFINFATTANQGNYLIISNKLLGLNSGGSVDLYRQYRSSTAGGSFNAKIYDIDDLVDEFAFGIKKHPLSVKNFLQYARNVFAIKPQFSFIIGKAVTYDDYRLHESSPNADRLNLVPTFGWPASDDILASNNLEPVPATLIGRISAIYPSEVQLYLEKIEQYEKAQQDTSALSQTIESKAWMKDIVHVVGVNDQSLSSYLTGLMGTYQNIIQDTLFGALVYNFNNTATGPVTQITQSLMAQLFNSGLSLINYFGHASSTTLDYNFEPPSAYNNNGKYPVFIVNGCNAGSYYAYDTSRFSQITSLAESWVFVKERGAIGFIASTHFGVVDYLDAYNRGFYQSLDHQGYDKPVTVNMRDGGNLLLSSGLDSMTKTLHAEETVLQGDPALKINASSKPDFVIEEPEVVINPAFISVTNSSFNVKCYFYNIGKAVGDSVSILIKRTYPDGTSTTLLSKNIKSIRYEDSVSITVPIVASKDKGQNELTVSIDLPNKYDETTLTNNIVTKQFFIYEDELTPIYPYNFAIISKSNQHLFASTANPILPSRQYVMEMDTTELFNSSFKISKTQTSVGGALEFDPGISYSDSTVYYWRVAPVPTSGDYHWNNSSFVYISNSSDGFNQSHLYQHLKSTVDRIYIDSFSRKWNFGKDTSLLFIRHSIHPPYEQPSDFQIQINGKTLTANACLGHSIIFNVFDPATIKPLYNQAVPSVNPSAPFGGFMRSAYPCDNSGGTIGTEFNFEFSDSSVTGRQQIVNFLNWIPAGYIVTARLILDAPYVFAPTWKNDPLINGTNLYLSLKAAGFSNLDSFYYPRTWIFMYEKNTPSFTPQSSFTFGTNDQINYYRTLSSTDSLGFITSPLFGIAKTWKTVQWRGYTLDATSGDKTNVDIIGVDTTGRQQLLYTLSSSQQDFDISSISATTYPYLQLRMRNADSIHFTPYQLRYWRILYLPVPEGALAANIASNLPDTLDLAQPFNPTIAFKNVSDIAFADSIKVNVIVYDKNNVANIISAKSLKKIIPGDTALVSANIDTKNLSGANTLFIDVNPLHNNWQPEQFHFNNFLYKNFVVKSSTYNPLLDVTFDGVHILNNDIVSANPLIHITLKDQSKYLLLNDTSLITVQLQYPDGTLRRFAYTSDTLRFNPATGGGSENSASVDFNPALLQDGQYILYVSGKNEIGSPAGTTQYTVSFQVYNKPMITNMFNYPNPFTTSTAFVFTITGSQVPQNIRIQILTITGKIVREITKAELGPLHIGRNITEFKWDGTDMYGQKLANGVYLYRVLTNLNGKSLDKFPTYDPHGNEVNTDQYFTKGYGKMYLMR
ncbi:MAG: C25 family cysteine peptidase [Chitinophagaceae bacterium]